MLIRLFLGLTTDFFFFNHYLLILNIIFNFPAKLNGRLPGGPVVKNLHAS